VSLNRYSRRALTQRIGRTIFTILSIVIGVAAVLAVMLLTASTRSAYKEMFAAVTGKAKLQVVAMANTGFNDEVLAAVEKVPGVSAAVPLLNRPSKLIFNGRQIRLSILGIDPQRDKAVRDYKVVQGRELNKGNELLLDEEFARQIGVKVGDRVKLQTHQGLPVHEIVGFVRPEGSATMRQTAMVFMPLDRAQFQLNYRGKRDFIDSIQVIVDEKADVAAIQQAIANVLPDDLKIEPPTSGSQLMQQTMLSSEQGLWLATSFMLLMGSFIILNTFLMNLGERRRQLAIMRAIGATRWQLTMMLIKEAVLLGAIGTVVGIGVGLSLAYLANNVLAVALEATLPKIQEVITWQPFAFAVLIGFGISLLGVLIPAWRAGRVSPLEGMSHVTREDMSGMPLPYIIFGFVCMIVGGVIVYLGVAGKIPITVPRYGALLLLLGAGTGFVPLILQPFSWLISKALATVARVESSLALRQVLRHRVRTSLTVFVLFLAGCAGVALANSLLDNVKDVRDWANVAIAGDFILRSMMPDMGSGTAPDLPTELGDDLRKLPQITNLEDTAFIQVNIPAKNVNGLVPSMKSEAQNLAAIAIARSLSKNRPPAFDLVDGDPQKLYRQMHDGGVVIGTVLAQRLGLKLGDQLPMETVDGIQQLPIVGVTNEYMVGGLAVHMQRDWAEKLLAVQGVDGYVIQAEAKDLPALRIKLQELTDKYGLLLHSKADLNKRIDAMVSGINGGLWVLIILGFVIAAFGVVNTLTMNVLEQTRELGMLRIVAMTKKQVRTTIIIQALIIGASGILPGVVAGIGSAYVMNFAMMPSFGRPIGFNIHTNLVVMSLIGSLVVVLVAAWLPARRATRINVVEALHYE
jgi:putative ABC transport system permease protein